MHIEEEFYQIKVCGGVKGCPHSVIDDNRIVNLIKRVNEEEELEQFIAKRLEGKPVRSHHRFKAAVSGCPNSCSEPQIKDFAVIGQQQPFVMEQKCNGCGVCVTSCRERGIELRSRKARVLWDNCLSCGRCISACSKGAIASEGGYKVIIGGRLGRRPVLARTLVELADEGQVEQLLRNCIRLYKSHSEPEERLSHLVDRLGLEKFSI
ncbi:dissimilatory sulfite reductase (desulfoviridin) alpha/beta subunit [Desulfitispora alkaliphila]|uniref:4Fe-4S dicluster domain-containing protein n=1 Tax=Desulfitispora alkaliphila TaxID=622674 RepID=UPI003D1E92CB